MIRLLHALRSSVRPLAIASGRVASARRAPLGLAPLLMVTLLTVGCDGSAVGLDGPVAGGGTGVGTGGGGTTAREVPAFTTVTAGEAHTCALTELNVAWCWGANVDAQLGFAGTSTSGLPDTVHSGGRAFRQITAGGAHTCAVDPNGVGYCWGRNANGQLGTGTAVTRSNIPIRLAGSRAWLSLSAGANHTCGIADNGTVWCWGGNASGQVGNGTTTDQRSPVQVSGLSDATSISAGDGFTCAVRQTGVVVCWGRSGRLGSVGPSLTPRAVDGTGNYGKLDAGSLAACAVETSVLRASCWGDATAVGSAGAIGTSPSRVDAPNVDVNVVSVGGTSACALSTNGFAGCWGSNDRGQLGVGPTVTATSSLVPLAVVGDPVFQTISVGGAHACAITPTLLTFCWGSNTSGQLGTAGSSTPVRTPTRVP